jgi:6-hydroxycyclohex-1-ene-1-carbonyl-CoA dehydrogenase
MTLRFDAWQMVAPNEPLVHVVGELDPDTLADGQVVVAVAGCGVCHTDLGFLYEGVRTRHPLPLTLGHEIAGVVTHAGADCEAWVGAAVLVPAVTPCGRCAVCRAGRGAICAAQHFPGNDDHGGFASHVVVPGRGLCRVDRTRLESAGLELAHLSVLADAATTAYQALRNGSVGAGDVVVIVGAGGVGSFGVQIARAFGARVVALDVDAERRERAAAHGAELALDAAGEPRALRRSIAEWAKQASLPAWGWKVFEMSGHPAGQTLAYGLLGPGAHLGVVGYTREAVSLRLSNLMAFDAEARGTWGCLPEHYPAVVDLALDGHLQLAPLLEPFPMSRINAVFEDLRAHRLTRRPVLLPDFE